MLTIQCVDIVEAQLLSDPTKELVNILMSVTNWEVIKVNLQYEKGKCLKYYLGDNCAVSVYNAW